MLRNGLYLITPDEPDPLHLVARVQPLLPFASCLQFRNKAMPAATLREAGTLLRDACPSYPSEAPARYVLELNAGEAARLGLKDGAEVRFGPGIPPAK